jgi:hypothetical protein
LEEEGFLRKRTAAIVHEKSQATVKLEPDVNNDSNDEDLFEFPSDKKVRLTACEPANEDDGDIFAFPDDDVKPKPRQNDQLVESTDLPKKRKFGNDDVTCERNSFSKKPILEKDVRCQEIRESHKKEPMEHSTTLAGFLNLQHMKVSSLVDNFKVQWSHILCRGCILQMPHKLKSCVVRITMENPLNCP